MSSINKKREEIANKEDLFKAKRLIRKLEADKKLSPTAKSYLEIAKRKIKEKKGAEALFHSHSAKNYNK